MFRGRYQHSLDAKGRLSLPAAFRKILAEQEETELVITRHPDLKCLAVYPQRAWADLEARLEAMGEFDEGFEALLHLLVAEARDVSLDKLGRVLLPPEHRQAAELDREVWVAGALKQFRLWSPANYEAHTAELRSKAPGILKRLQRGAPS